MLWSKTKVLAAGACLFGGLGAGVTANPALVELPAWEGLGAIEWAGFSRAENHGVGAFFYLVIGFLAQLSTVTTTIAFRLDPSVCGDFADFLHMRRLRSRSRMQ